MAATRTNCSTVSIPALIITDIILPDVNFLDTIKECRRRRHGKDTWISCCPSRSGPAHQRRGPEPRTAFKASFKPVSCCARSVSSSCIS